MPVRRQASAMPAAGTSSLCRQSRRRALGTSCLGTSTKMRKDLAGVLSLHDGVVQSVVRQQALLHTDRRCQCLQRAEATVVPELPWYVALRCHVCHRQNGIVKVAAIAPHLHSAEACRRNELREAVQRIIEFKFRLLRLV